MSTRTEIEFLEEELAAADRATAEFRRQCSELAGELGAARAVVREILAALGALDAAERVGQVQIAKWRRRAGVE